MVMKEDKMIYNFLYQVLRRYRANKIVRLLENLDYNSILDVGCIDDLILKKFEDKECTGVDLKPKVRNKKIWKMDFMNLKGNKFDVVLALEMVEHTEDPVAALNKLKKLCSKYLIISVPYEPYFTMSRFFKRLDEHIFIVKPLGIKKNMKGFKLVYEEYLLLRYYLCVYERKCQEETMK